MIVVEFNLNGKSAQYQAINEAIQTAQFGRNPCLRYWMDNQNVGRAALYRYNTQLRAEFLFVEILNSHACQASVEGCWSAITRFYQNCKQQISGKKGYPTFKKHSRSVEYKTTGWKLSEDRKRITFTNDKQVDRLKRIGSRDSNVYQLNQIKRVRLVRTVKGRARDRHLAKSISDSEAGQRAANGWSILAARMGRRPLWFPPTTPVKIDQSNLCGSPEILV